MSLQGWWVEATIGNREPEIGNREPETGKRKPETGNRETETGNREPENGKREPETGNRKPETGNRETSSSSRSCRRKSKRPNKPFLQFDHVTDLSGRHVGRHPQVFCVVMREREEREKKTFRYLRHFSNQKSTLVVRIVRRMANLYYQSELSCRGNLWYQNLGP
jgi:hypothetical protein